VIRKRTYLAGIRMRWLIALLYVAGALVPSASMAWGDGAASAYCLEEITELTDIPGHAHAVEAGQHHDHDAVQILQSQKSDRTRDGHDHSRDGNCCGLFGFAAVMPSLNRPIDERMVSPVQPRILVDCLVGCAPGRIDRPPRFLLPM
jgi:hypothetical protein